jgi:macrolide-specific efflux system membrane fusion protein
MSRMKKLKSIISWILASRKRAISAAVILIIFLVGIWFLFLRNKNQAPQYQTAQVEKGSIVSTVSASGSIISSNTIDITTNVQGVVKKVYVKDGDKVVKGQKIAEVSLNPDSEQQSASAYSSYLSAKNNLDSANTNLYTLQSQMFAANQKFINDAVARDLAQDDPTYIQEYADWKAAEAKYISQKNVIAQSQAGLNSAWLSYQLSSPIISSPMSGTISNLAISEGIDISSSSSSQSSFRVAVIKNEGNAMGSFNLSEIDVPKVEVGQKATITLDSIADKTFTGKVVSVDRIGTVTSNVTNYPVVIRFDTDSGEILPNMSATANIIIETKDNVLLVPSAAIKTQGGQSVVSVLENGQERTVNVEAGISSDTQTEIISGLTEGQTVVIGTLSSTQSSTSSSSSIFGAGARGGGAGRAVFLGR